jgi:hypothetical protein
MNKPTPEATKRMAEKIQLLIEKGLLDKNEVSKLERLGIHIDAIKLWEKTYVERG